MLAAIQAALLLAMASCADFSFYGVMQGVIPGGTLQISPLAVTLGTGATCAFLASGGSPPYSFALVSGGGSIEADSGLYTAPVSPDNAIIQVQDSKGATSQATATVVY
jgi:hypothetical protein